MSVRQQQFGFPDEDLRTSLHDQIVFWLKKSAHEISKKLIGWTDNWDEKFLEVERTRLDQDVENRKKRLQIDLSQENPWGYDDRNPLNHQDKAARLNSMRDHLALLKSWTGLGEPPPRQIEVSSKGEVPIKRERYKTFDIIGYADIVFSICISRLNATSFPTNQFGNPMLGTDTLGWRCYLADPFIVAFDAKTTIPSFGQILRDLNTYREFRDWPFVVVSPETAFAKELADEGFGFIQYPDGVFLQPRKFCKSQTR